MAVRMRARLPRNRFPRPGILIGLALSVLALVAAGCTPLQAPPAPPGDPTITVQGLTEVHPLDTTELGVPHPNGIGYDAAANTLAIAASSDGGTKVAVTSPYSDFFGASAYPPSDPSTLAVDPVSGTVGVLSGQDEFTIPAGQVAASSAAPTRSNRATGVATPAGAAYDRNGSLLVLDATRRTITRAGDRTGGGRDTTAIPLSQLPPGVPLRGLAVNPADGLLYVGSPSERRLYGVDDAGTVRAAYDLSPLALEDQQGFTFAPSSDTTDDPGIQHLFVADGGGSASLGQVMEAAVAEGPVSAAASTVVATQVQRILTSTWNPASPDPSGIEYLPGPDRLEVVDSEVDETTGAGYHNVNMWQITRAGVVTDTGTTWTPAPAFSKEPTGLGYDAGSNTLFISDDSYHRIWIDKTGPDNRFGTADDVVTSLNPTIYGSNDTEDPEFDPTTGHLFFIDGVNVEVYEIDPVDGVFGNGNDTMTHFDVGQYGPTDIEGLGSDPVTGNLLVGGRVTKKIYEVTKQGALVQTIDASGISGMRYISGLQQAPASDGSGRRDYWTVDRNIDNGAQPSENDGQIFELRIPSAGNTAPVANAGSDQTISAPTTSVSVSGSAVDDGLPNPPATVTYAWSQVSGPATVTFANPSAAATTASGFTAIGDYVLRLTANDSALTGSDDLVVHVVANQPPTVDAGADQTISAPTSSVNLAGAVSDDGFPSPPGATTKTWTRASGPTSVTFGDASNPVTTASGLTGVGDYVLRLTANDGSLSTFDEMTVHVVANQAPVVNAGPDQTITLPTSSTNLSGSVSDDGSPNPPGATTKTWTRVSGPTSVTFGDASNPVTTVSGLTSAGDYVLRLTADDGASSSFDELTIQVTTSGTFTIDVPVAAGSDDAEQSTTGSINITSTDLDMTIDGTTQQSAVGLRFPNVTVPAGATIQSAYVQFRVDETGSTTTQLLVQGEANDNAPTFTTTKNNITARARTVASAAWNPVPWPTLLAHGTDQQTSDLAAIVQELVLRPGWTNGNAMAFIITGSGQRVADSLEGSFAPVLHVVYTTGGPPPNQRPVVNAGPDQTVTMPAAANLNGSVSDDGLPNPPGAVTTTWTKVSGPGTATFANASAPATTATFDQTGTYVLRLSASDSALTGLDDVTVTVLGPGSLVALDFPLVAGSDDAEEGSTGNVNITSTDLDMMLDNTKVQSAVGLRFANVTLPPGAAIVSASVQFRSDEAHSDATSLLLQGQAIDNAPTFTTAKNSITTRARTGANVAWNPAPWLTTSETGPDEQTSDLRPIVQELVSRPGWASGNAMVLIVTGSGRRVADAFEGSAPAVLHVVYQL